MTRISLNTMTLSTSTLAICALALALAACSREAAPPIEANVADANVAQANAGVAAAPQTFALNGGDGAAMGNVILSEDPNGVTIKIDASGLPAGAHGVHLHEKGLCEGPKFASAGGHWNPGGKQHGRDNVMGAHLGDLANLEVAAGGGGSTSLLVAGVTISGAGGLADADGTSLVIHAKPDDYKTDPSGDSGDRISCAVVAGGN